MPLKGDCIGIDIIGLESNENLNNSDDDDGGI